MKRDPLSVYRRALCAALGVCAAASPAPAGSLKQYPTKYYVLYTDLPEEKVLESTARLNAMAEQYYKRTRGFGGTIRKKLPFYLYASCADYSRAVPSAAKDSAGIYTGKALMATADVVKYPWDLIWHVVQHEGFHQFVHRVIGRGRVMIPIWINEGLAEYFGSARWTGDRLMTGLVLPQRKDRLLRAVGSGKLKSLRGLVGMSNNQWVREADVTNYDQVWSLVHFFVHAKDGKYKKKLGSYISLTARGVENLPAFIKCFGGHFDRLQKEYEQWWRSMADERIPTRDRWDRLLIERLVAFLSRGHIKRIRFESADDFFRKALSGEIALDPRRDAKLWLPPSLLEKAAKQARRYRDWELKIDSRHFPMLVLKRSDGTVFHGRFKIVRSRPEAVIRVIRSR